MTKVSLVATTVPQVPGCNTPEDFVAYCARVSNPSNQNNTETSGKLLKYLVRNKHWSPFEMVTLVMEIETTRDIARQILRHRSFSFQEFSQRYARADDLGFTVREARLQDPKNRQASNPTSDQSLMDLWLAHQETAIKNAEAVYNWALDQGIAKEQARAVLPEGLTMSRMYMSGSLRSWIHYYQIRSDLSTQKEHREVAIQVGKILQEQFPSISEILSLNG